MFCKICLVNVYVLVEKVESDLEKQMGEGSSEAALRVQLSDYYFFLAFETVSCWIFLVFVVVSKLTWVFKFPKRKKKPYSTKQQLAYSKHRIVKDFQS